MPSLNRRRFLQSTAGALSAIGLNQLTLTQRANRYGKALAQDTPRKVALLVGINDYERNKLGGALNDVELQKQLLIHRFGFNPNDIHTLREQQATRLNILGAFEEYLYEPAKAGDVVVFHFSGHGDHVLESDLMRDFTNRLQGRSCIDDSGEFLICRNTALAPYRYDEEGKDAVQDIMGHTLLLMRTALARKTDNVTFVLDCCYAGGGKRGNVMMRSQANAPASSPILGITPRISDIEWEYQQSWLERLSWTEQDFIDAIKSPVGPGFFAGAAGPREYAADYPFDGFVAGAFTYLLTQHLWQTASPLSSTIPLLTQSLSSLQNHEQTPVYDPPLAAARALSGNSSSNSPDRTIYHITPDAKPAEAVVLGPKEGSSDRFYLWLGGLDPQRLAAFDRGAVFSVIDKQTGEKLGDIQQVNDTRDGLLTEGQLMNTTFALDNTELAGQFLQEKTRGIPEVVVLKISLDETLTPTEQAHVKAVLGEISNFEVFSADPGRVAHALLGRYTDAIAAKQISNPESTLPTPMTDSIGIFSPSQVPILTGSFGQPGESIEDAVNRLWNRFISLHIGRMLALMVNGKASKLNIDVTVSDSRSQSSSTTRGGNPETILLPQQSNEPIKQIPLGNEIDVIIRNNEPNPLHFGLLVIDSAGDITVLFPLTSDDPDIDLISPNNTKTESLVAVDPIGIVELLVIASPSSLVGPLETLSENAVKLSDTTRRGTEVVAEEAVSGLFDVLGSTSASQTQGVKTLQHTVNKNNPTNTQIGGPLGVEDVAVVSLYFEIVP
ncbi:MAG: caspase family protein [Cyanobacteria bacterium J06614_10]